MRGIYCIILALHSVMFPALGQQEGGARTLGMSGASAALSNDTWATWTNPGGLTQLLTPEVAFTLSPRPFGLPELSSSSLAFALPLGGGTAGFAGRSFGSETYREIIASVGFGVRTAGVGVGATLNATHLRIDRYGSATTLGFDLGCLVRILENLRWGFTVDNVNAPSVGQSDERLPRIICTGVAFIPVQNLRILLDMEKTPGFEPSLRLGLEARLRRELAARAGAAGAPDRFSIGLGFQLLKVDIDIASVSHPDLGWSHHGTVSFRWSTGHE